MASTRAAVLAGAAGSLLAPSVAQAGKSRTISTPTQRARLFTETLLTLPDGSVRHDLHVTQATLPDGSVRVVVTPPFIEATFMARGADHLIVSKVEPA